MEKKMIITADDYGMCSDVDLAIDDCIKAGLLTSTNVIVNIGNLSAAKTLRQRFPTISIGLHWNVTAGKPVSAIKDIPTLIESQTGEFYKPSVFMKRYSKGLIKFEDLQKELIAQYQIFEETCGKADYWNVHQNSSLNFSTFPAFNKVALKLGINKTRTFKRVYLKEKRLKGIKANLFEWIKKNVFLYWFGVIIPKSGTLMPDGRVIYFDNKQKSEDLRNIGENILWGKNNIIELVIHPAITDGNPLFGTLSDMRVKEWKMFSSKKTAEYLKTIDIQLVNFNDIR